MPASDIFGDYLPVMLPCFIVSKPPVSILVVFSFLAVFDRMLVPGIWSGSTKEKDLAIFYLDFIGSKSL